MPRKCPPGGICFENITIIVLIVLFISCAYFFYLKASVKVKSDSRQDQPQLQPARNSSFNMFMPQSMMSMMPVMMGGGGGDERGDVLMNPYQPPLRDDNRMIGLGMAINVPTQMRGGFGDTSYRQVGILTRMGHVEMILPLMGRPVFSNRDKWNFYTMSDISNVVKLPIRTRSGRDCTSEYGCDNLSSGEIVRVEGYRDDFKVTSYDNQALRYIPFL